MTLQQPLNTPQQSNNCQKTKALFLAAKLSYWFKNNYRDLPWRKTSDPYAIWVSEIMLQQTQVATVIAYYERWMKTFPTIEKLAHASIDQVIKLWEGLGYYSRARNLHAGAKQILKEYKGVFPKETEQLLSIKGIGPYTKGAILSFAFKKRSILVDGNVKRVISRFFDIELDFSVPKNHKYLEKLLESILPENEPWVFNEALMELGALVCSPKSTQCSSCPVQKMCAAFQKNKVEKLPIKVKRKKQIKLHRLVFVFYHHAHVLIQKNEEGIMQDLYEFPYHESSSSFKDIDAFIENKLNVFPLKTQKLKKVIHGFTHHHVTLTPFYVELDNKPKNLEGYWVHQEELSKYPFSSGHRKILKQIKS